MKKITILIPVYNEDSTISEIVKRVEMADVCGLQKEIIIIDDFSQDNTRKILSEIEKSNLDIKVLYHKTNQGKGAAIQSGKKEISGDMVLIQDADLEYNPEEYPKLIDPILKNQADVIYGSRFMGQGPHRVLFFLALPRE